jgi:hypothetical protein
MLVIKRIRLVGGSVSWVRTMLVKQQMFVKQYGQRHVGSNLDAEQ